MSNDVIARLDWAVQTHAVCVIDATVPVLDRFEVGHDRDGKPASIDVVQSQHPAIKPMKSEAWSTGVQLH